jgi:hypothetical protein
LPGWLPVSVCAELCKSGGRPNGRLGDDGGRSYFHRPSIFSSSVASFGNSSGWESQRPGWAAAANPRRAQAGRLDCHRVVVPPAARIQRRVAGERKCFVFKAKAVVTVAGKRRIAKHGYGRKTPTTRSPVLRGKERGLETDVKLVPSTGSGTGEIIDVCVGRPCGKVRRLDGAASRVGRSGVPPISGPISPSHTCVPDTGNRPARRAFAGPARGIVH